MAKPQVTSRIDDLEALRKTLLITLDGVEGRDVGPIARELRQVIREIDEVRRATPKKGSLTDDLAQRRAGRVGAASGVAAPAVGK
jgi:hypothetical protein